jgi:hypothetical protein
MNCFNINSKTLITIVFNLLIVTFSYAQNIIPFQDETGKYGIKIQIQPYEEPKIVVQPKYDSIKLCEQNCFIETYYNYGNQEIQNYGTGLIQVILDGKVGLVNINGDEIVQPKYDFIGACGYNCDYTNTEYFDPNRNSYITIVFSAYDGKFFLPRYEFNAIKVGLDKKVGFIDLTGKEIINPIYDEINFTNRCFFEVRLGNKKGVLDNTKKEIISIKYEDVIHFNKGPFFTIAKLNGKWNFIDSTEKHIEIFLITDSSINNHTFNIEEKRRYFSNLSKNIVMFDYSVLINKAEKKIIAVYDGINFYDSQEKQNLFRVNLNGKYGFIDSTAKEVIPLIYDDIGDYNEGLAIVSIKDQLKEKENYLDCDCYDRTAKCKYGFIDETGKIVIPLIYDNAEDFINGKSVIKLNNKWGVINSKGKYIIPVIYDELIPLSDNLIKIKLNNKYGFIDSLGNKITPINYSLISDFNGGFAQVAVNDTTTGIDEEVSISIKKKWGIINKNGVEIIPTKFDTIEQVLEKKFKVGLNNKFGLIDKTGKNVIPILYDEIESYYTYNKYH